MRDGVEIPPVELCLPNDTTHFKYRLQDGFHRFYASVAVGFEVIPAIIKGECIDFKKFCAGELFDN